MSERITVEISDGIADVRLNRGDKMNAMDGPMFKALIETADELAKTKGCGPLCFPAMARPGAQASTFGVPVDGGRWREQHQQHR